MNVYEELNTEPWGQVTSSIRHHLTKNQSLNYKYNIGDFVFTIGNKNTIGSKQRCVGKLAVIVSFYKIYEPAYLISFVDNLPPCNITSDTKINKFFWRDYELSLCDYYDMF